MRVLILLLLFVSCSSSKPPPHVHVPKYLIAQGTETNGVAQYGAWYACCECGAELWLTKEQYDWLMAEQQREGGQ